MRMLFWLPIFALSAFQDGEPELPPIATVTLRLENIPTIEAAGRFARAAGCTMQFYQGRHGWAVDQDDLAKAMTLDLKDVPFFDAVDRFCRTHGNLSYEIGERMKIVLHGAPARGRAHRQQGRLLVWSEGVEEELQYDFARTTRRCTVQLKVAWQPGLRVLAVGPIVATSAVDDRGRELVGGAPAPPEREEFADWNARGPVGRPLVLPVAPREARSMTIRGRVSLQVPRRAASVELPFGGDLKPVRAGWVTFRPGVEGKGDDRRWRCVATADQGKLSPDQILDLRQGSEGDYEYWIGWGKGGSIRSLADGSLEMVSTASHDGDDCLRFTLVEGRSVLQVPFELKDVELPR